MQGNAGWSSRQFVSGLLKVNSYLQRSIWMIFLSPVSCAAISDGCLQGSNDANWVLHCTNIVLCVVPASSSAAKQQILQLINKLESIQFGRFYDFYSVLSWAAKRMPKSSCFHERISPAVGPVNFCIVHRLLICNVVLQTTWLDQRQSIVCVCVWSIVLDQECKRLSTAAKLPSTLRWRVHFVLALWAACSDTNMSNQLNLSKNNMIDIVLYTCLSKS